MFRFAYNTNGLAHHRVVDALRLVSELGYEGLSITPDVGQLDPFRLDRAEVRAVRDTANELGLALSIETGARFVLDPRRKHHPSLLADVAAERERRVDLLRRCVDLAAELGADVVSLWSGAAPDGVRAECAEGDRARDELARETAWRSLCDGLDALLRHARGARVRIAFEPEPGMFIERPAGYDELCRRLGSTGLDLGLCLDVGHCVCTGDLPVSALLARYADRLLQVHLDDIRARVHEHVMFGNGDLDLVDVLRGLLQTNYTGLAAVELSRDSHRGADAAREALSHLRAALARIERPREQAS